MYVYDWIISNDCFLALEFTNWFTIVGLSFFHFAQTITAILNAFFPDSEAAPVCLPSWIPKGLTQMCSHWAISSVTLLLTSHLFPAWKSPPCCFLLYPLPASLKNSLLCVYSCLDSWGHCEFVEHFMRSCVPYSWELCN